MFMRICNHNVSVHFLQPFKQTHYKENNNILTHYCLWKIKKKKKHEKIEQIIRTLHGIQRRSE